MRKTTKLRNIDILPKSVVPIDIRLEVYKEALKIVKRGEPTYGLHFLKLCLLLPSILWNLKHYMDDAPSHLLWVSSYTKDMFPELNEERVYKIINTDQLGRDKTRIIVLREMIKEIENEKQKH